MKLPQKPTPRVFSGMQPSGSLHLGNSPGAVPSEGAGLEKRPEAESLVGIYAALGSTPKAAVLAEFGNAQFSTFKKSLAELAVSRIAPVNAAMNRPLSD